MEPSICYNAWIEVSKTMLTWEKDRATILSLILVGHPNVRFLPHSGLYDINKQPVFLDDVVMVQHKNEFGSIQVDKMLVVYCPCAYFFRKGEIEVYPNTTHSLERIGNYNEDPTLLD